MQVIVLTVRHNDCYYKGKKCELRTGVICDLIF